MVFRKGYFGMSTASALQESSVINQRADTIPIPIRIVEVELGQSLPVISAIDQKTGQYYKRARCLVRLHDHPLGIVELQFNKNELFAHDYIPQIWHSLNGLICEHLRQDGLPLVTELVPDGLTSKESPLCIKEREAVFVTAPFASIIVSTHDRTEQLSRCLPTLLSQHYPHYEVIIVDNAPSTTATADLIQKTYSDTPKLRYIREDTPGLSRGLNCGISAARGSILAFTDDDVVVDAYWLLQIAKAFSLADDVVCVTGLVMPLELETWAQVLFEEYGGFGKGFNRRMYDMMDNHSREPLYPYTAGRFGTGASMAFKPAFLQSIGGFDPALHCGMDVASFFQAVRRGHKLVYEPAALVYHAHRRSYTELQKQIYNYGVALTAYLTKSMLDNPRLLFEFLSKIPYGLFFTLSDRSPKNKKKSSYYPKDLTVLELKGMLIGSFVYLYKRWQLSRRIEGRHMLVQEIVA